MFAAMRASLARAYGSGAPAASQSIGIASRSAERTHAHRRRATSVDLTPCSALAALLRGRSVVQTRSVLDAGQRWSASGADCEAQPAERDARSRRPKNERSCCFWCAVSHGGSFVGANGLAGRARDELLERLVRALPRAGVFDQAMSEVEAQADVVELESRIARRRGRGEARPR